jgi:hypothetical protein
MNAKASQALDLSNGAGEIHRIERTATARRNRRNLLSRGMLRLELWRGRGSSYARHLLISNRSVLEAAPPR